MTTQSLTTPMLSCNFVVAPEYTFPAEPAAYAASEDYGFDFNEEELAEELLAPLPAAPALTDAETHELERSIQFYFS